MNKELPILSGQSEQQELQFMRVPSSVAVHNIMGAVTSFDDNRLSCRKGVEVSREGLFREVTFTNGSNKVKVIFRDIDQFSGFNQGFRKLLLFILYKVNEHCLDKEGRLISDTLTFSIREFAKYGAYSSLDVARHRVRKLADSIGLLAFQSETVDVKSSSDTISPFTVHVENGVVWVGLNKWMDWKSIANYITIIPSHIFALPNKSFDLAYYIFYLARQNVISIKRKGYFNISFRKIQERLHLPKENETQRHTQLIKEPIKKAIAAIQDVPDREYAVIPHYSKDEDIKTWLDDGYIRIEFTEHSPQQEYFIEIADKTERAIEAKNHKLLPYAKGGE